MPHYLPAAIALLRAVGEGGCVQRRDDLLSLALLHLTLPSQVGGKSTFMYTVGSVTAVASRVRYKEYNEQSYC